MSKSNADIGACVPGDPVLFRKKRGMEKSSTCFA